MSEFGSATLKDMVSIKRRKRQEQEEERQGLEARKTARIEKRDAKEEERAMLAASFEKCNPVCVCGTSPCPMAELKRCATCGDIKKRVCGKQTCKAARDAVVPLEGSAPTDSPESQSMQFESEVY